MLSTKVIVARPIRVVINSNRKGDQWGQIKDASTNRILHTGRLPYIRRTAKVRYNHTVV